MVKVLTALEADGQVPACVLLTRPNTFPLRSSNTLCTSMRMIHPKISWL